MVLIGLGMYLIFSTTSVKEDKEHKENNRGTEDKHEEKYEDKYRRSKRNKKYEIVTTDNTQIENNDEKEVYTTVVKEKKQEKKFKLKESKQIESETVYHQQNEKSIEKVKEQITTKDFSEVKQYKEVHESNKSNESNQINHTNQTNQVNQNKKDKKNNKLNKKQNNLKEEDNQGFEEVNRFKKSKFNALERERIAREELEKIRSQY